jgi:CHAT domain-containing protein
MDPIKNPDNGFVALEKLQTICGQHNTNVLFFNISDTFSFGLVVQPENVVIIPLGITRNDLQRKIQTLLYPLYNATPKNLHAVEFRADMAYELYNDLFRPITDSLDLAEHLFIVPGTTLLNVPFELLLTKRQPQQVYTTLDSAEYSDDFLQHDHFFTYSPSLMPLLNFDTHTNSKSLIIFSNPEFYDQNILAALTNFRSGFRSIFERLPFSLLEGEAIENVYQATHKSDKQVTKKTVLNSLYHYDIVHIATHAFVDSVFESFSGLALSTENDHDDGLLMGYELQGESFDNELIVLSACESGAGQFVAGEGVLGLPRLMLRAGAKSVLMSLWKVHDAFPAELMPTFYDNYLNNAANKSQALALAKRHILKHAPINQYNYKHPFFWATFCLYGSPGFESSQKTVPIYIVGIGVALIIMAVLFIWRRSRQSKNTI